MKKLFCIWMCCFVLFSCKRIEPEPELESESNKPVEQTIDTVRQELNRAIYRRDISTIEKLIQDGMSPDIEIDGQTLIYIAIKDEWDELVLILVDNGTNLYSALENGDTYFSVAVAKLQETTLFSIIDKGFDVLRLNNRESRRVFEAAVSQGKVNLLKTLLKIDEFVKKLIAYDDLIFHLMWNWTDETGTIMDTLLAKGFVFRDDGSLYYHAITGNYSYKAIEWLFEHGFSTAKIYENETISYWADSNLRRRRKSYDDSGPSPEDSPIVINAKKIKELIDGITVKEEAKATDTADTILQ